MLIIKKLRCDNKNNPIGIDSKVVKISWQLESSNRNVKQLAYQLQVAKDKEVSNYSIRFAEGRDRSKFIYTNQFVFI